MCVLRAASGSPLKDPIVSCVVVVVVVVWQSVAAYQSVGLPCLNSVRNRGECANSSRQTDRQQFPPFAKGDDPTEKCEREKGESRRLQG